MCAHAAGHTLWTGRQTLILFCKRPAQCLSFFKPARLRTLSSMTATGTSAVMPLLIR